MRVALDAMGGDRGARPAVEGALLAAQRYNIEVALVGRPRDLKRLLAAIEKRGRHDPRIHLVEAADVIRMTDHPKDTLRKKNSSLAIAVDLVKRGEADALVSAGNTGAVLANTLLSWRTMEGIRKPAIAAFLPSQDERVIVIDAGANVDCKPHQLVNFAIMGSVYARDVLRRPNPRIGLLSIGEEETKGNEAVLGAHKLLRQTDLNFLGNAEGRDIFTGDFDVITCDGFVGNVVLKTSEGIANLVLSSLKREVRKSVITTLGAAVIRPAVNRIRQRTDYDEYGGAPLLGVNGIAIIAHGRSNKKAYMNALRVASECHNLGLVRRLKEELDRINKQLEKTEDTAAEDVVG